MKDRDFDRLFAEHSRAVRTYAISLTRDSNLADEVVQDTFVRAWKYLDTFDGRGSLEGWLIRICRNCAVDVMRKQGSTQPGLFDSSGVVHASGYGTVELWDLIDRLPGPFREVIVLVSVLGYRQEFVAELLGVSHVTVRTRLLRARGALREQLAQSSTDREVSVRDSA